LFLFFRKAVLGLGDFKLAAALQSDEADAQICTTLGEVEAYEYVAGSKRHVPRSTARKSPVSSPVGQPKTNVGIMGYNHTIRQRHVRILSEWEVRILYMRG
jgi:hypothetical protein